MPRNGSGQYNPLTNTWNPPVTGVLATGADFQAQLNDISAAITQSVSKDGQTPMTANLPMGNNSIVGIASGTETSPSISANGDTNTGLYFPAADTVGVAVGGVNVGNFTSAGFGGNLVNGNATLAAGTAAAPSLTTTGDTNTGLYFPAADTVAIATGGVKRVEVDANGNLGIGQTANSARLHVKSNGQAAIIEGTTARGGGNIYAAFNDPTGRKGYWGYGGGDDAFYLANEMNAPMLFFTNNTERARITSDGNLLVGTTGRTYNSNSNGSVFNNQGSWFSGTPQVAGANMYLNQYNASGQTSCAYFLYNGTVVGSISMTNSTTAYNQTSDYRLKENIQPMTGALAKVAQLKPCTYKWKVDGSNGQGFIAHELQTVIPDCVTGEKDAIDAEGNPKYQGIDTSFLVATLTAAIKEQQALIESQKTAIESLTARIAALEAK